MKILTASNAIKRGAMIAAVVTISSALVSCTSLGPPSGPKGGRNNPFVVKFNWQNAEPCKVDPESVTPEPTTCTGPPLSDFCVGHNQWVQWESTPAKKYDVYFSPFVASSTNAGNNGITKKKITDKAPHGYYKYTILADGCNADTDGFDPMIRVDK